MCQHKLMLGTVQFGQQYGVANRTGVPNDEELKQIKHVAENLGIRALDTASSYGGSEEVIGKLFDDSWHITTKCFLQPESKKLFADLKNQIGNSLRLLNRSSLNVVLLHRADEVDLGWNSLRMLRDEGVVKKIGVSLYYEDDLSAVLALPDLDVVQIPLNIFDQRFIQSGILDRFKANGVEVQVRSIFLQGLLLMQQQQRPRYFSPWAEQFEALDRYLQQENISATELCLNFPLHLAEVDKVVIGVESAKQLTELGAGVLEQPVSLPQALSCSDPKLLNPSLWKL